MRYIIIIALCLMACSCAQAESHDGYVVKGTDDFATAAMALDKECKRLSDIIENLLAPDSGIKMEVIGEGIGSWSPIEEE